MLAIAISLRIYNFSLVVFIDLSPSYFLYYHYMQ